MSNKKEREKRREQRLTEEQKVSSSDNRRQRLLQMAAGAVFLVVVAVVVLVVANSSSSDSGGDANIEEVGAVDSLFNGIPQEGLVLGKASAPVELIEFGDLQCPVCKEYSEEILPEVIESKVRSGEAKIDFRNFTIISEESIPAGAAAIAAGKQGRGWYFIELFYRNQGEERSGYVTDEFLTSIAKGAGVKDMAKWNKERNDPKTTKEVEATFAEAQKFGFNGTPSFAIQGPSTNGVELPGSLQTPGEFEEAIEEAS
ncbi:MAG TPA: thioredoxin domain-containing protein [Solirubrobacterales bacterium]|nr:thioredoxin domain-containing protein [Solirubrobacterales bacterium]